MNGTSGYRVDVTVTDRGKTDTFRLVVTDGAGTVVYDSLTQAVKGQIATH